MTTTPKQQKDSIKKAAAFLLALTKPKVSPRVPKAIRAEAKAILEHFPMKCEDLHCCAKPQTPRPTKACGFKRLFEFFKT